VTARVLIIDDIAANISVIQARLRHEYYRTFVATSGEQGIALARLENPDVILLDVMMPGMDGFETCQRLKADLETRHIPVVMVTALGEREDRLRGLAVGADDFLSKPVNDLALISRVRALSRYKQMLDVLRAREINGRKLGVIEGNSGPQFGHGGRILLLEHDERQSRKIIRALSQRHRVIPFDEAGNLGPAARAACDLLIVPLQMQGVDGLHICAALRTQETTRHLPIIAITERTDESRALRALELGVNDIVMRPIDPEELAARVATQIKRKRYADALKDSVDQSMEMAVTDQLTGLYNRRFMENQIAQLMKRALKSDEKLSIVIADIDHFKKINDVFGHDVGDDVLREFASRLATNFRPTDLCCRIGGEEFVIIMPNTAEDQAASIAERLRRHIADAAFKSPRGDVIPVTVSAGIAGLIGRSDTPDALIRRADQALYSAKTQGRNRIMAAA
jgi:response regulator receiver modulated diguanylate cyclase